MMLMGEKPHRQAQPTVRSVKAGIFSRINL